MSASTTFYTTDSVSSDDGTTIGYRQIGSGPGLLFLHGGIQASQNYMRLAVALSDAFTIYVPDRRGRGLSGPPGEQYSMAKECEDVEALLSRTSAHFVFGHSAGALIALQAALTLPSIRKSVGCQSARFCGFSGISTHPKRERDEAHRIVRIDRFVQAD